MAIEIRPIAILSEKIIDKFGTGKKALARFIKEVKANPEMLDDFFDYWENTDGKTFMESQERGRQILGKNLPIS